MELFSLCPNTCVVMANNHTKDLGWQGICDTREQLSGRGIPHLGAGNNKSEANAPQKLSVDGKHVYILNYNFIGLTKFGLFANIYGASKSSFGAAYLPPNEIRKQVSRLRVDSPDAFILLVLHHGKDGARSIEEAGIDYSVFEQLGADCIVFHHSHQTFGSPNGKSFFLGDFIFRYPGDDGLHEDRPSAFVELTVNTESNEFEHKLHHFQFRDGVPSLDKATTIFDAPSEVLR